RRQEANDFSIQFDADLFFVRGTRDDLFRERVRDFTHPQVRAEIQTRCIRKQSKRTSVANRYDVKVAIVQLRSGRNLHGTAVVSRVCYTKFSDTQTPLSVAVDLNQDIRR